MGTTGKIRYRDGHDELLENRDQPDKIARILASFPDGGQGYPEYACADLRWSLVLGQVERSEALLDLLVNAARGRKGEPTGYWAEIQECHHEVRALLESIGTILGGELEEGIAELERILGWREFPGGLSWVGTIWIASAERYQGNLTRAVDRAQAALEMARELDQRSVGLTLCLLGELYHAGGYDELALPYLDDAEQVLRDSSEYRVLATVLMNRARILIAEGQDEAARRAAAEASALHPSRDEPMLFLAWSELRAGFPERAEAILEPLIGASSSSQEHERLLATIRAVREGKIDREVLREYIRLRQQPTSPRVVLLIEALIEKAPDFQPLRELLAWHLLEAGDLERSAEVYDGLVDESLDPDLWASVLLGLGRLASRSSGRKTSGARIHAAASAADDIFPRDAKPMFESEEDEERTRIAGAADLAGLRPGKRRLPRLPPRPVAGLPRPEIEDPSEAEWDRPVTMSKAWQVSFVGDLSQLAVPDLIQFLGTGRRTGTLVISSEHGIGVLHLQRGKITGAMSPGCPNIGEILLADGTISREQLDEATERQRGALSKQLLGVILISVAGLEIEPIQRALVKQVLHAVREVMTWNSGRFSFEPDPRLDEEEARSTPVIEIDPQWVLLEACRMEDEESRSDP